MKNFNQIVELLNQFYGKENNCEKILMFGVLKIEFESLDILCQILQAMNKINVMKDQIQKRISKQIQGLEKKPEKISYTAFLQCDQSFIKNSIVLPLKKLVQKGKVNQVSFYLENLEQIKDKKIEGFEDLLENGLLDSFNKQEQVYIESFKLIKIIICHNDSQNQKMCTFIDNMVKKMFKKENPILCQLFCNTISQIICCDKLNLQKLLEQFFESNQYITYKEQIQIKILFLKNKSFLNNNKILEILLTSSKIKSFKNNYYYEILDLDFSQNDTILQFQTQEKQNLIKQTQQLKDKVITIQNYSDFIYGNFYQLDNVNKTNLTNQILNKNNFFYNKNFFNTVTNQEIIYILKIFQSVENNLQQNKDQGLISLFFFKAFEMMEKVQNQLFDFSIYLISLAIEGSYIFNLEIQQKQQEKLSPVFIENICKQQNYEEAMKNQDLFLKFLKIISFSDFKLPLRKNFIKNLLLSKNYDFSKKLKFQEIQYIFEQNSINHFEQDIREQYQHYLAFILYFFPTNIKTIGKFYNQNLISKLTRIQRVQEAINNVQKQPVWLLNQEQFQALTSFGYRELNLEQEVKQTIDLKQILKTEIKKIEDDDENYQELETFDKQEIITENYFEILYRLYETIQYFSKCFNNDLKNEHKINLDKLNQILHNSVLNSKYLKLISQQSFEQIFSLYIIAQNKNLKGLSEIYCYVIKEESSTQILNKVELFIQKLKNEVYQSFDEKIYDIFYKLFLYLVNQRQDVEMKQKIFDLLMNSIPEFPNKTHQLFLYICNNINELYFNSCFEFFEQSMIKLAQENENIIDEVLMNFLIYQEFAMKLSLKKIDLALKNSKEQKIESYQKLKILLMTYSQNEEITQLSKNLIEKYSLLKLQVQDFENLQFKKIIHEMPKDLHSTINQAFKDFFESLQDKSLQKKFLDKILIEFNLIIQNIKEEEKNEETEERLELFPNILKTLITYIQDDQTNQIFDCLIKIEKQNFTQLTQLSFSLGISMIHQKKHIIKDLVKFFQKTLQTEQGIMSPLIYIGECVKIDKNLAESFKDLEKEILKLLNHKNLNFHKNLSSFLRVLISFFKNPKDIINKLISECDDTNDILKIQINCYFIAGLMKGIGIDSISNFRILEGIQEIFEKSTKKDMREISIGKRYFSIFILQALWSSFKKLLEQKMTKIIQLLVQFLGDFDFQVRENCKQILDFLMKNMSNYSIKLCIPILLKGTEDKNWRTKLNSIHGLAAVSYCGIKQLSENLPIIVPKLTLKLNDTNEDIRKAALKSLSLILSTIKNPEISQIRDIIIKSLSDPYQDNERSLDALMNIRFMHYIDGPSLSLIIPIIIYGLKNAKGSQSKQKSAKIVANILTLIQNDSDIWPHIENLIMALQCALKDVDNDVRALTSKAFKSIGQRFPNLCNFMLNKLKATLIDENTISIAKSGNAQAFAEILSTQDQETIENILQNMIELTQDKREHVKESFLSVFVYLPIVFGKKFQKYVKSTMDIVIISIACETEMIRNLAIKSLKMLIHNFFDQYQDYFVDTLYEKAIDEDPIVRKSALILIGDIIEVLNQNFDDKLELYNTYPKVYSILYIMRNDQSADVRFVSNNIFKTFVENTPKCIKSIFGQLMEIFMDLYQREDEHYHDIANNSYKEFIQKYGNSYLTNILNFMINIKKQGDNDTTRSISILMKQLVIFFNKAHFNKTRIQNIQQFLKELFEYEDDNIWKNAVEGMKALAEVTNGVAFLRKIIKSLIHEIENPELDQIDENQEDEEESDEEFIENNDENQEEIEEENIIIEQVEVQQQKSEKNEQEEEIQQQENQQIEENDEQQSQENQEDESEENNDSEVSVNPKQDKLIELICQLLMSGVIKIVNFANDFVFMNHFKEWQIQVLLINARVYGQLLYQQKDIQDGIKFFLEYYEENQEIEFQEMYLYLCTELCKNLDSGYTLQFLGQVQTKITLYSKHKNFRLLFFIMEMLRGLLEGGEMKLTKKILKISQFTSELLDFTGQGQSFLLDKSIEIIKNCTNIVEQERSGELLTFLVNSIKEKIEKDGNDLQWLQEEKLIGIYLNLVAKVLRTQETHVSLQGVDALIFFLEILDREKFVKFKENIYGYILRALSFSHTDNFLKKVFVFFEQLLKQKLYPDEIQKYLFIFLIHSHNQFHPDHANYEDLMNYTHNMIEQTQKEYNFLKKWKQKVLNDGQYDIEKLNRFILWKQDKSKYYQDYVDKINEQQIIIYIFLKQIFLTKLVQILQYEYWKIQMQKMQIRIFLPQLSIIFKLRLSIINIGRRQHRIIFYSTQQYIKMQELFIINRYKKQQ